MRLRSQLRYEREYANMKCGKNSHCERIAGSGRAKNAVADCVLLGDRTSLVEVKSIQGKVFRINGDTRLQLERMVAVCNRLGLGAILAIRFKRYGWKEVELNSSIPKKVEWSK